MSNTTNHNWDALWTSEAETELAGKMLAALLQPSDVIALMGDLGAGKTRFVQAVAKGLGVPDEIVHSPTFTLIHEYAGRLPLRHCDAYRLRNPDEFPDLGLDELFAEDGVAFVEWADRVAEFLPRDHLRVELTVIGPTSRQARITGTGPRSKEIIRLL